MGGPRDGGSLAVAVSLEVFPEIDSNLRILEIELDSCMVERLLVPLIVGHDQCELLMPLASPGDLLFDYILDFRCESSHSVRSPWQVSENPTAGAASHPP